MIYPYLRVNLALTIEPSLWNTLQSIITARIVCCSMTSCFAETPWGCSAKENQNIFIISDDSLAGPLTAFIGPKTIRHSLSPPPSNDVMETQFWGPSPGAQDSWPLCPPLVSFPAHTCRKTRLYSQAKELASGRREGERECCALWSESILDHWTSSTEVI